MLIFPTALYNRHLYIPLKTLYNRLYWVFINRRYNTIPEYKSRLKSILRGRTHVPSHTEHTFAVLKTYPLRRYCYMRFLVKIRLYANFGQNQGKLAKTPPFLRERVVKILTICLFPSKSVLNNVCFNVICNLIGCFRLT